MRNSITKQILLALASIGVSFSFAYGSSHREAPMITEMPKVDATDFYMFVSYEEGRSDYVTIIANYIPLQDPGGGPNYFTMDPDAIYEIHIDNNGDAKEDLTFRFDFEKIFVDFALPVGSGDNQQMVPIPLINAGQITADDQSKLLRMETYTLDLVMGDRRDAAANMLTSVDGSTSVFTKPVDYIGMKSLPEYEAYAAQYMYDIALPGTTETGRLFVGQKKDPFVVNLGETFDLINISTGPTGSPRANLDTLRNKNVTSIVLEIPISFLVSSAEEPVIAGWTTASVMENNDWKQVSRLANPLVNELVIGLTDKDKFNMSEPMDDGQFATYVTHPTLPELIEILFEVQAPDVFPRTDLVAAFLTGVDGLNKTTSTAELMRLNTSIAPVGVNQQDRLGVIAGDTAGFPNGRRPGDDVVDIALRVVMGVLLPEDQAPAKNVPFTDGAFISASDLPGEWPYLNMPLPGSPNDLTPGQSFFSFTSAGDKGTVFYDFGLERALYTRANVFPFFYDYEDERWIYWYEGTFGPRKFWDTKNEIFFDAQ